ncbi:MAG: hypothetical protein EA401_03575 [Planctomycetota bacterium]|nr:MAG: hypothetical protein EA401_03575 [Planctomycetota bacterium]
MNIRTVTPARHGGLLSLIGLLVVLAVIAVVVAVVVLGRDVSADVQQVRQQLLQVVGPSPIEGRVTAVRDGSDRNLPTYASVRLESTTVYTVGDVFQVVDEDQRLLAQLRVEAVDEEGPTYTCIVLPDTWRDGAPQRLPQGATVYAPNRE